jgi:hypothetical protein
MKPWMDKPFVDAMVRVTPAWQEAARRLGGRHDERIDRERGARHTLVAEVDGLTVAVEHFQDAVDLDVTAWSFYTRARASVDEPGLTMRLLPADERYVPEVVLGVPAFDQRIFVETSQPRYARSWFEAQDADLPVGEVDFRIADNLATATVPRILGTPDGLERLVRDLARFAGGGRDLRQRWREAAHALGARVVGRLHHCLL